MTRPQRHAAGWLGAALALVGLALVLPGDLVFVLAGLAWGLGLAGFIARGRYGRARSLLAQRQYEAAFDELLAFEQQVRRDAWRRQLAFLFTGFHTADARSLALAYQGVVRLEQGRLAEAEALLAASLEADPGNGLAWANRALVAASRGDEGSAKAHVEAAARAGFGRARLEALVATTLATAKKA